MKILGYELHPIAKSFPLLEGAAFELFCEDVKHQGGFLDRDVYTYKGKLLDGANRGRAQEQLGANTLERPVRVKEYTGDDPIGFAVSRNMQRAHYNDSQRALIADKLCTLQVGRPPKSRRSAELSQEEVAAALNVSERSLQRVRTVRANGIPELVAAIERGDLSLTRAAELALLDRDQQLAALEAELKPRPPKKSPANDQGLAPASALKQLLRTTRRALEQLGATVTDLDAGGFRIAYAGVEWHAHVEAVSSTTKAVA